VHSASHVVVVGGLNVDLQGTCRVPFRPCDSNPGQASMPAGGVGRNIAENLARLGCRVDLVSVLGDDSLSGWLRSSCEALGIGMDGCLILPDTPVSQYLCLLDSDGSLVGAVAAMDGMDSLTPKALEAREPVLDAANLIVADANLPEAEVLTGLPGPWPHPH
jgi:pseudouridine kinase